MTYNDRNTKATETLHPTFKQMVDVLFRELDRIGEDVLIDQAKRSISYQNWLWEQGRKRPGKIVTWAKGGESLHNYGCAIDFTPITQGGTDYEAWDRIERIVDIAREIGFECGWDWTRPDSRHLQYTGGFSIADFKSGKAQKLLELPQNEFFYPKVTMTLAQKINATQKALLRSWGVRLSTLKKRLARLLKMQKDGLG